MGKFEFSITDDVKDYAGMQVSQLLDGDLDYYLKLSKAEYSKIKGKIGNPKRVLELGCGLGRMSIYLDRQLNNPEIKYILADSTGPVTTKLKCGWNPPKAYYNDMGLTKKFCFAHELSNISTFDLQNRDLDTLNEIDLVMSFMAVGFHYPIEDYMHKLLRITNKDCVMVFGIRKGKYTREYFKQYFNKVNMLNYKLSSPRQGETKEEIVILRDKK